MPVRTPLRASLTGLALFLGLASPALAQDYAIDQGSVVLGGTVSFSSQGGDLYEGFDGDRLNTLLLNPSALFFVSPGLAVGGDVYVQRVSQGDASLTTLGIGPEVRYYFGDAASTTYPFIGASIDYASLSSDDGDDATGFGYGAAAGLAFMLSPTVALTAEVDYSRSNLSFDSIDIDGNEIRLELGISAFLY